MKIIVHYPTTAEGKRELARRVSEVHGRAVLQKINDLPLDNGQKLKLLEEIKQEFI